LPQKQIKPNFFTITCSENTGHCPIFNYGIDSAACREKMIIICYIYLVNINYIPISLLNAKKESVICRKQLRHNLAKYKEQPVQRFVLKRINI
jgi:hypothetical protein